MASFRKYNTCNALYGENRDLHNASDQTDLELCYERMYEYKDDVEYLEAELDVYEEDRHFLKKKLKKSEFDRQQDKHNFRLFLKQEQREKEIEIQNVKDEFNDILGSNQEKLRNKEKELKRLKHDLKLQQKLLHTKKEKFKNRLQGKEHQLFELKSQHAFALQYLKNTETKLSKAANQVYYFTELVECQRLKIQQLEQIIESMKIDNINKCQLRIFLNKRLDRSSEIRKQLRQALKENEQKENELAKAKLERDLQLRNKLDLERKLESSKNTIRELVTEKEKTERDLQSLETESRNKKVSQVESNEDRQDKLRTDLKEREGQINDIKTELYQVSAKLKITEETLNAMKANREAYPLTKKQEMIMRKDVESGTNAHMITSLKYKIQQLEEEVKNRDQSLKDLKEILNKREMDPEYQREFMDNLKSNKDQLSELKNQLKLAASKLNDTVSTIKEIRSERDIERHTRQELERETKVNQAKIGELEQIYNKVVTPQKQRIKDLERDVEHRDLKVKRLKEDLDNRKLEMKEERELRNDVKQQEGQFSEQGDQLRRALTKLKETEAMLNEVTSERNHEKNKRQELEWKVTEKRDKFKTENDEIVAQLNERIQNLETDVDRRDMKIKSLKDISDKRKLELEKERELTKAFKNKEDLISEQKNELHRALTNLRETEDKLNETTSERDSLKRKANENNARFKDKEQRNDKEVTTQKQRIRHLEREVARQNTEITDLKEMSGNKKSEADRSNELGNVLRKTEDLLAKLEDQLKQTSAKLKKTETELEETKTRLSKAMGDRLTDNNPNIADLSDKNRPVKLAERYAELYDNQWTDAFDILAKYCEREQQTIEALLAILQDVMHFCIESGSKQMKKLHRVLGFSNIPTGDIPVDVRKNLKDGRKAASSVALRNLYETYLSHLKRSNSQTLGRALEVRPFVKESLEICWLMVIQDPPVVFSAVAKPGAELNTDVFKPYTISGTHVEYTVWPALLLHEGGPVLAKGVAQGYGKKAK